MDWTLAIEKNREALRRILAMLVAMVASANGGSAGGQSSAGGQFPFFPQVDAPSQNPALAEKSKLSPASPGTHPATPSPPLRAAAAASGRSSGAAAHHPRRARAGGRACTAAPACRQAEAGPQPKQRFRHRCGDPARSAAGLGPGAGSAAFVHRIASAFRPAQTVRWPPVCETARRAAHQVLR